jgi:hypothetical protein
MSKRFLLAFLAVGVAVAAFYAGQLSRTPADTTAQESPSPQAAAARGEAMTAAVDAPAPPAPSELDRKLGPNDEVKLSRAIDPREFRDGIACPGGGYLPLLNGVPWAPGLSRDLRYEGPVPPVVSKFTTPDGIEWYRHADGSSTTSKWIEMQVLGTTIRTVQTNHLTTVDANTYGKPADYSGTQDAADKERRNKGQGSPPPTR